MKVVGKSNFDRVQDTAIVYDAHLGEFLEALVSAGYIADYYQNHNVLLMRASQEDTQLYDIEVVVGQPVYVYEKLHLEFVFCESAVQAAFEAGYMPRDLHAELFNED